MGPALWGEPDILASVSCLAGIPARESVVCLEVNASISWQAVLNSLSRQEYPVRSYPSPAGQYLQSYRAVLRVRKFLCKCTSSDTMLLSGWHQVSS